ncbi:MAG: DUF1015 domain-containing protein [Clostridia bacterium]|nr:DUF1015 domain-containing protein [Clostridia bacterium]
MKNKFFYPGDILLPKDRFDKWAVIACDQYTSEPEYWAETEKLVGDAPSALKIILPEVYLTGDDSQKIEQINKTMVEYIKGDIFQSFDNTMIYTRRVLKEGKIRHGIVGLIDLEDYSYEKGADTLIRATEETVLERIPARVNIRRDAALEIPHIMLLIDDEEKTVIEPIAKESEQLEKVYDFNLLQNAGSIKGFTLGDPQITHIKEALGKLYEKSNDGLLFAVGDGNHSLASAKECYKQGVGPRYALVEMVNIHDKSLEFEPIYRIVFGADESLVDDFIKAAGGEYYGEDAQKFTIIKGEKEWEISVKPTGSLSVATLQSFLDEYLKDKNDLKIDYIHGTENVRKLCKREKGIGFLFDGMKKSELFFAVANDGCLPRKTFSMGLADDKRFYLEARKIK